MDRQTDRPVNPSIQPLKKKKGKGGMKKKRSAQVVSGFLVGTSGGEIMAGRLPFLGAEKRMMMMVMGKRRGGEKGGRQKRGLEEEEERIKSQLFSLSLLGRSLFRSLAAGRPIISPPASAASQADTC